VCAYARTICFKDQHCAINTSCGSQRCSHERTNTHKHTHAQHARAHAHTHTHNQTHTQSHSLTHSLTTLRHAAPTAQATHTHLTHKLADRRGRTRERICAHSRARAPAPTPPPPLPIQAGQLVRVHVLQWSHPRNEARSPGNTPGNIQETHSTAHT
jgi:hypothetical protein